jgi:hypothetical protein
MEKELGKNENYFAKSTSSNLRVEKPLEHEPMLESV